MSIVKNYGPNVEPKPGWPPSHAPGLPHGPEQPPGWIGVDSRTFYEEGDPHAGLEKTRFVTRQYGSNPGDCTEHSYEFTYDANRELATVTVTNEEGVVTDYAEVDGQLALTGKKRSNVTLTYSGTGLATYKASEHHTEWGGPQPFFKDYRPNRSATVHFAPDQDVAENPDHSHKVKAVVHDPVEGDVTIHYGGVWDRRTICQVDAPNGDKHHYAPGNCFQKQLRTRTEYADDKLEWYKPIPHDPEKTYKWQEHVPGKPVKTFKPPRAPNPGRGWKRGRKMTREEYEELEEQAAQSLEHDGAADEAIGEQGFEGADMDHQDGDDD